MTAIIAGLKLIELLSHTPGLDINDPGTHVRHLVESVDLVRRQFGNLLTKLSIVQTPPTIEYPGKQATQVG